MGSPRFAYTRGDRVQERFEIVEVLGIGCMGTVYRVFDHALESESVALKVLSPEIAGREGEIARFRNEVLNVRKIVHPNIVSIYDFGLTDQGHYFYTMEYVRGESLHSRLYRSEGEQFPFAEVISLLMDLCQGLSAAHREGVIHCDLKPENILIDEEGRAKITDFGLSSDRTSQRRSHRPGTAVGTPYYMSPEQFRADPLDHRADIYALGIVAYEMATHRKPFKEADYFDLADRHFNDTIPNIREFREDLPPWFQRFVGKCAAKDRNKRFQTAVEATKFIRTQLKQKTAVRQVRSRRKTTFFRAQEFEKALGITPRNSSARQLIKQAGENRSRGLSTIADAHYLSGRQYFETADYQLAERHLTQALQLDPYNPNASNLLGFVYEALGRTEEAEKHYHAALRVDAYHEIAYFNLGKLYHSMGKTKDALVYLGTFISIARNLPEHQEASREAEELRSKLELDLQ